MIKRFNTFALVAILAASLTLTGCTTVQRWSGGGALLGAAVGGTWANSKGILSAAEGAFVGAAAGAAAGALVGDMIQQREIRELEARIADLEAENEQLRGQLAQAQAELARLREENAALKARIAELEKAGGSHVQLEMTLLADAYFEPGSARLTANGRTELAKAAKKIKAEFADSYVTVQGHTDSQPIRFSSWRDNWELGSARSLAVLRYLIDQGVNAERASAETFSMYRPVAPNTSPQDMAKNRRAVIVVHTGINVPKAK